jgi:DNA-binding NtrC family response regulator
MIWNTASPIPNDDFRAANNADWFTFPMNSSPLVLHVDDDPSILAIVSKKLESHGVTVVSTTKPTEAIKKLLETGARVVLLDIDMPEKDGLTLLHEIKQVDAGIQVIMCTGMVSIHTVLRATALGAETCIFKPIINLNEVTEAVDRAFEKIDRWWIALKDWMDRKKANGEASSNIDVDSKLFTHVQSVFGSYRGVTQVDTSMVLPPVEAESR